MPGHKFLAASLRSIGRSAAPGERLVRIIVDIVFASFALSAFLVVLTLFFEAIVPPERAQMSSSHDTSTCREMS